MVIMKSFDRIKGLEEYYEEIANRLSCKESDLVELEGDGKHLNSYFGTNELQIENLLLGLELNNIIIGDISLITDIEGIKYVMEKKKDGSMKVYGNYLNNPSIINSRIEDIRFTSLKLAVCVANSNPLTDVIKLSKRIENYILTGNSD